MRIFVRGELTKMQPIDTELVRRWLALGAGGVAVFSVILALVLNSTGKPACAAPIPTSAQNGTASFFSMGSTLGNCSYPTLPADDLFVALPAITYSDAAACGTYLQVEGPRGKVRVLMLDRCANCSAERVDLSRAAFARIADPVLGIVNVKVRTLIDPQVPGPLTFRLKEGSSANWFAVLVGNHGNQLSKVEVSTEGGSWRSLERKEYNYWVAESGVGLGAYRLRVTDVRGHQVTVGGIRLAPGETQKTSTWMYTAASSPGPTSSEAEAEPAELPGLPDLETFDLSPSPLTSTSPSVGPQRAPGYSVGDLPHSCLG